MEFLLGSQCFFRVDNVVCQRFGQYGRGGNDKEVEKIRAESYLGSGPTQPQYNLNSRSIHPSTSFFAKPRRPNFCTSRMTHICDSETRFDERRYWPFTFLSHTFPQLKFIDCTITSVIFIALPFPRAVETVQKYYIRMN